MALRVLGKASYGIGKQKTQAAEGCAAMEGIDGMTKDEGDAGERRETYGYELLTEDVDCEVIIW